MYRDNYEKNASNEIKDNIKYQNSKDNEINEIEKIEKSILNDTKDIYSITLKNQNSSVPMKCFDKNKSINKIKSLSFDKLSDIIIQDNKTSYNTAKNHHLLNINKSGEITKRKNKINALDFFNLSDIIIDENKNV